MKLLPLGMLMLAGCSSAPPYPVSDHYDGSRFISEAGHSFAEELKWIWEMKTVDWPDWVDDAQLPKPPTRVTDRIRVTYVNHATVLIQMNGVNILTDPIWSHRAGPFSSLGTRRVRNPGVKLEDLPPIDAVLVSHNHFDHLDLPTLRTLAKRDNPIVFSGLGNGELLREAGFTDVRELDWWAQDNVGGIKIVFVPAQHESGRGLFDSCLSLWGGFVVDGPQGTAYFAGDSGFGEFIDLIAERYSRFDVAILPIGSYEARWFMRRSHMNPEDAVRIHLALHAKQSIGMHFGTFLEHPEQTIDQHESDLAAALTRYEVRSAEFVVPRFGEGIDILPGH